MQARELRIYVGGAAANQGISLQGACTTLEEAHCLRSMFEQAISQGTDTLWVDCQQLQDVSYVGQQAIFQVEQIARAAQLIIYWCGLSGHLVQELSATGLYLLLRCLPATSYQGPENVCRGVVPAGQC